MSTEDHPDWWKPIGGANSQDSTLERRSTIWNNGPAALMAALGLTNYRCKFFPRGCRGYIDTIDIYCDNPQAPPRNITIYLTPVPQLGPLYTYILGVPGLAAAAWRTITPRIFWNYDSLFIYWQCENDVAPRVGYDEGRPFDYEYSTDKVTWIQDAYRFWVRANYTKQTPGDVPISGTVNNIPIPNISTAYVRDTVAILVNVTTQIIDIVGAGFVDYLYAYLFTQPNSHNTQILIECDGAVCWNHSFSWLNTWTYNDDTQPTCLIRYADDDDVMMMITKKWEFRRRFRILALNVFAGVTVSVTAFPNLVR